MAPPRNFRTSPSWGGPTTPLAASGWGECDAPGVKAESYATARTAGLRRWLSDALMLDLRQLAQSAAEIEVMPELGGDHAAKPEARERSERAIPLVNMALSRTTAAASK